MIDCVFLYKCLLSKGVSFFTGVPDSLLKDFCDYLTDHAPAGNHVIAANEGGAVALACGHYLASGSPGLVYMQNSGQGNAVNPLLSLCDPAVYGIPMVLLIGWRGEPDVKDEPQHVKQGQVTLKLLEAIDVPYVILPDKEEDAGNCIEDMVTMAKKNNTPSAIIVRKGIFAKYDLKDAGGNRFNITRERAIQLVAKELKPSDAVISTTGKISRELYEYREQCGCEHDRDFLTVGSMGHASQIALGVAKFDPDRQVFCFDGDGSAIMHMGSFAIIGSSGAKNFKHVIFNNGVHDSVGGQPTVGLDISFTQIALACGYKTSLLADSKSDITAKIEQLRLCEGPALLEIRVDKGSRLDLGRPAISPDEGKHKFMEFLSS